MDVLVDGEIVLFGTVGEDFFMDGFTAMDVVDALARVGRANDVTVRLNSGGGYASEGVAIFNALKAHRGAVSINVEGIAASSASIIAMAGDTVAMAAGAIMMVHEPSVVTVGDADEHQKSLDYLDTLAAGFADIYSERTDQTVEECRTDMKAETWMTADEAVAKGYADSVDAPSGAARAPTAFDYRIYSKTPERMVALAAAKGWKFKPKSKAAKAASSSRRKEIPMAKTEEGAAAATKTETTITAADVAAAATTAKDQGKADGVKEGTAAARADAAEIVRLCTAAGVPTMAEALIKEGVLAKDAPVRIASAKEIRDAVAVARKTNPQIDAKQADAYIAAGTPITQVRADLFAKMAAAADATVTDPTTGSQAAASASWDDVVARVNQQAGVAAKK